MTRTQSRKHKTPASPLAAVCLADMFESERVAVRVCHPDTMNLGFSVCVGSSFLHAVCNMDLRWASSFFLGMDAVSFRVGTDLHEGSHRTGDRKQRSSRKGGISPILEGSPCSLQQVLPALPSRSKMPIPMRAYFDRSRSVVAPQRK